LFVGEFGTVWGKQEPVYMSSSSPAGHDAAGAAFAATGTVKAATAGAAAKASANPPARMIRRAENSRCGIVTLSVVSRTFVVPENIDGSSQEL
jgi:hypothetical protein